MTVKEISLPASTAQITTSTRIDKESGIEVYCASEDKYLLPKEAVDSESVRRANLTAEYHHNEFPSHLIVIAIVYAGGHRTSW